LFAPVEKIIEYLEWKDGYEKGCIQNFDDCRRIVEDFDKIDLELYAFRYPIDTKGKGSRQQGMKMDSASLESSRLARSFKQLSCSKASVFQFLDSTGSSLCRMAAYGKNSASAW
jgi:hypothetical protein